jgi:membrane protein implicated in regulation of membrane protease activity
MESLEFLLENLTVVIWAIAILVFSILTVLVPFFVWRISANVAAIREVIEAYLYEEVKRKQKSSS